VSKTIRAPLGSEAGRPARAAELFGDLQPRYASVAGALSGEILDGRLPMGAMLPSEGELCARFGVSRTTVREALRRLRELGLVEVVRGVGSRVLNNQPRSNYVLAARSVTDVMGYADRTELEITGRVRVHANAALAGRIGCEEGTEWCHVSGVRRLAAQGAAISCVDLYISADFAEVANDPALVTTPAYRLIGQKHGVAVAEVLQDIAAIALERREAELLDSRAGRPGLHIRRRFYAAQHRLLEATFNVHPSAERFSYALQLGTPDGAG
jgi:DNA-binding GntR family transcriptional regulator